MEEGTRRLTNQHTYIYKKNIKQRERKDVEMKEQGVERAKNKTDLKKKEEEEERDGVKEGMRGQVT